ncbi:hypothetical protein EDD21DRAFT_374749 [Dissophora ornata]|nr:hypothetical protein BGZ58_001287 [Dissophora ornata]KAI8601334.1 hypothetical protein EDD21DRAFT_374749 [Dissophora ornata]
MNGSTSQDSRSSLSHQLQESQGSSSSSGSRSHIDLTGPAPPRIIHPRTLPSQSVEIIEVNSDDETPHHSHDEDDERDEVLFVRETPAPAGSASGIRSANGRQMGGFAEILLHNYFRQPEIYPRERQRVQRLRTPEDARRQRMHHILQRQTNHANTGIGNGAGASRRSPRRTLRERIASSGIWGYPVAHFHQHAQEAEAPRFTAPLRGFFETVLAYGYPYGRFEDDVNNFAPFFDDEEPHRHVGVAEANDTGLEDPEEENKPLVPARPGHTKTLNPDVTVACPMCQLELGHRGKENTKLWVVVGCGHVICDDCIDGIFVSKIAIKGTKARRPSVSKKAKGKGKAKWTDADEEPGTQGNAGLAVLQDSSALEPKTPLEATFKVVKRTTGSCPSCSRKIKRTAMQQLYL